MKDKRAIIAIIVIVLVIGGGALYFLAKKTPPKPQQTTQQQSADDIVLTMTPEDLGLTTTIRDDKKAMKFQMTNIKNIQLVEYQMSYTKEINGEQVPEGLIGEVKINPGDSTAGIAYREFGTCSSGRCRYDKVVSSIKLTLKVTKTDGKVYQVEKTVDL